ncbi:hypothetical protein HON22_02290 [Candidatus Peregrinibacteria bacterium]|jgi:hypothetical protein|nr:hypothetical protein [Candidatus Peregrinibacteria bacterium]
MPIEKQKHQISMDKVLQTIPPSWLRIMQELKYKIKTQNYFEPYNQNYINREDLAKVLRGEVRNPHKIERIGSHTDYAYFIICNTGLSELKEEKERKFNGNMIDFFYNSQWFGQFTVDSGLSIIIPNAIEINCDPIKNYAITSKREDPAWSKEGFYQCDKNWNEKILTSNVTLNEMITLVRDTYPLKDFSNSLNN